jgi:hypothetical protein
MGLILYAVLIFFGARGMPFKHASAFCIVTAAILTALSVGAMENQPACDGLGCDLSLATIAFLAATNSAVAFASYGVGFGGRQLFQMMTGRRQP